MRLFKRFLKKMYVYFRDASNKHILKQHIKRGDELRIIVGASGEGIGTTVIQDGWISTDIGYFDMLNIDHWQEYFMNNKPKAILAEHVWEHLTPQQGKRAAQYCYDYLQDKGYVRLAIPDGNHPDPKYIENVKVNGTGPGSEDHKVLYNYETISQIFSETGFQIKLLEYFDNQSIFHAQAWDIKNGMIHRSKDYDRRNQDGQLRYTSIIIDAIK